MNAICISCGINGKTERHHVGGRKYSDVVTTVCLPCHEILSAWQTERTWVIGRPVDRVVIGALDIIRLMLARAGNAEVAMPTQITTVDDFTAGIPENPFALELAEDILRLIDRSEVFDYRPVPYIIDIPQVTPDPYGDYERFMTVVELLRDVAQTVLDSPPVSLPVDRGHCGTVNGLLVQVLTVVARLDGPRAITVIQPTNMDLRTVLRFLLSELETVVGHAMLDICHDTINPILALNRDNRLRPDIRAEIAAHAMRGLVEWLTPMTKDST